MVSWANDPPKKKAPTFGDTNPGKSCESQLYFFSESCDDLPLFSGTAPKAKQEKDWAQFDREHNLNLFGCPVCFGTGQVVVNGKTKSCTCEAAHTNKGE